MIIARTLRFFKHFLLDAARALASSPPAPANQRVILVNRDNVAYPMAVA